MHQYKQSGQCQDISDKTACTSLPDDEQLGCSKHVKANIIE